MQAALAATLLIAVCPLAAGCDTTRVFFAIGGMSREIGALSSTESFWADAPREGIETGKWLADEAKMGACRDGPAAVVAGEYVYSIGGSDGTDSLFTVERLKLSATGRSDVASRSQMTWESQPRMQKRRSLLGGAFSAGRVFAVGGFNGTHHLPNVEALQVGTDGAAAPDAAWAFVPPMLRARSGAAVVELDGKVYAIGGFDGRELLASGEVFDAGAGAGAGEWRSIPAMPGGGRAAVAAAVADGRVFVMGGNGGSGPLARVESYDPRARAWRAEPPLRRPRSGACAVGRGGALVVAGGGAAGQALPCVERLALRGAGAWIDLPGLCEARWGAALVAPTAGQVCS